MKTVRTAPPKSQTWQPIKKFAQPAPNPPPVSRPAPSNEVAAHAVRIASSPGSINPKQQVY
jgi:hypothetical protein